MSHDLGCVSGDYVNQFDTQITNDTFVRNNCALNEEIDDLITGSPSSPNKEVAKFYRLLWELDQELYPGCEESSTLSFVVEVLNWKCLTGLAQIPLIEYFT